MFNTKRERECGDTEDDRPSKRVRTCLISLKDLQDELLINIFTHIQPLRLQALSRQVCHRWSRLGRSNDLWRAMCIARWGEIIAPNRLANQIGDPERVLIPTSCGRIVS
jgi:hypothetical protein